MVLHPASIEHDRWAVASRYDMDGGRDYLAWRIVEIALICHPFRGHKFDASQSCPHRQTPVAYARAVR